ncbi:uncharacterized protein LOC126630115 [Malus sylvestris]|uniref:uncharacterized protein LOC126630115 n=1 Tax=Malus sylvestris TaxID=3752 RepID=UPI0021ABBE2C|nr:uncharacterized protein LOC126630115 [Malus sylvestris]
MAGPSTTTIGSFISTAESNALVRLQELLSLSASQILERQGLDSVGACLNNLATDGVGVLEEAVRRVKEERQMKWKGKGEARVGGKEDLTGVGRRGEGVGFEGSGSLGEGGFNGSGSSGRGVGFDGSGSSGEGGFDGNGLLGGWGEKEVAALGFWGD